MRSIDYLFVVSCFDFLEPKWRSQRLPDRQDKSQPMNDSTFTAKDFLQHDDFLDAVKNAVRQAVREEMKAIRQELSMLSTQIDLNESRVLSLEVANDQKSKKIDEMEKKIIDQSEKITHAAKQIG